MFNHCLLKSRNTNPRALKALTTRDRTWLILLEPGQNRRFFDQSEQRGRNWLAVTM